MEIVSKAKSKAIIEDLVSKFDKGKSFYKSTDYKEANVEDDFIKPFLKALNWNISNEGIHRAADREVIVQAKGKDGKEPDYLLQLDQKPCFYIEAKHPRFKLHHEVAYMWQAYSYAYSTQSSSERKKVDFSLLTDFEEFRLFDCTFKADLKTVNNFVTIDWLYPDYLEKFDTLWDLFEKEQVRKGSLKSLYLSEKKIKANRIPPDRAFLDDLDNEKDGWRVKLAKDIKKYNTHLSAEYITTAVQLILDRLIFLKVLSDREIENDLLREMIEALDKASLLADESLISHTLKTLLAKLNDTYNGSIFAPRSELEGLTIGNKTLLGVVKELSPENSRYNFKQIPVEILGTIYERFLGKVVTSTEQRVRIEYKPEVRKAGGVYYTPQYIVDYIVENTIGELLKECKSVEDLLKLKVCDPACGSGSFLLGAYDRLLSWALKFLSGGTSETAKKRLEKAHLKEYATISANGEVKLTAKLKRMILTSCIYGVDIDEQAVEVAKVSLSLKALDNATHDELREEMFSTREKVLPSLEENIRCGNSLIGKDIYENFRHAQSGAKTITKQINFGFDDAADLIEIEKLKPFDWPTAFPQVFRYGGFDAVIGNPPYGFHQIHADIIKPYFKQTYQASQGSFEHYFLFYEKALKLLNDHGKHGYIVPVTWLTIPSALALRKVVLDNYSIQKIIWLPELVFENAQVNTLISIIGAKKNTEIEVEIYDELYFNGTPRRLKFSQKDFIENNYYMSIFESPLEGELLKKINDGSVSLETYARPCSGYNPYEVGKGVKPGGGPHTKETVQTKPYHSDTKKGNDWKTEVVGRDLGRYAISLNSQRWIKYGPWLAAQRDPTNFIGKRLLVQEITGGQEKRIIATFTDQELYHSRDVIPVKFDNDAVHPYYVLAILNSKLITWYHHKRNPKAQKGLFPKVLVSDLAKIPMPNRATFSDSKVALYENIIRLVEHILDLNMKVHQRLTSLTEAQAKKLREDIAYIDAQIDKIVYQLYDLTPAEIKIIEEN